MLLTGTLGGTDFDTPDFIALQRDAGISHVTSNSCPDAHDRVLQTARMVGLDDTGSDRRKTAPELTDQTVFKLCCNPALDAFVSAWRGGITTVPILLGPVSFLASCSQSDGTDPVRSLLKLLPVYKAVLNALAMAGFRVQIHEPVMTAGPMTEERITAMDFAWRAMTEEMSGQAVELVLVGGGGGFWRNLPHVMSLPMGGLHVDMVRGGAELPYVLSHLNPRCGLMLGFVDGLNRFPTDICSAVRWIGDIRAKYPRRLLIVTPSTAMNIRKSDGRAPFPGPCNILSDLMRIHDGCTEGRPFTTSAKTTSVLSRVRTTA